MDETDEEKLHRLQAEVIVGELRGIERNYRRLEDLGIFERTGPLEGEGDGHETPEAVERRIGERRG